MTSPADVHAAKLAAIEAAADAEESLRERVAETLRRHIGRPLPAAYHAADAVIELICTPVEGAPAGCGAETALRRVLALAEEMEGWGGHHGPAFAYAADHIRDAAGGTA